MIGPRRYHGSPENSLLVDFDRLAIGLWLIQRTGQRDHSDLNTFVTIANSAILN